MNATIRSEQVESTEVDSNLAAVSEVEAGIRDFVRNDIAYLRRPPGMLNADDTTAAALEVLMGPDGMQPLLTRAVAAATRRSKELAK